MSSTCHQCNQPLLEGDSLNCPGCLELFHACCWPAHGADCLIAHPARPLLAPQAVVDASTLMAPPPSGTLEPRASDQFAPRCRGCRAPIAGATPFCLECGTPIQTESSPRQFVLVIEGVTAARAIPQAVKLLARLIPNVSREDLTKQLASPPVLLYLEAAEERLPALIRRLEREGLQVRAHPGATVEKTVGAFFRASSYHPGVLAELGFLGAATCGGLLNEPVLGLAALAVGAARFVSHFKVYRSRYTLDTAQLEGLRHPLASDRGDRIRQTFQALRDPGLRDLARRALVGYEQAIAAAEGDNPLVEHLWQPVAPLLLRYLEQLLALAARADRLERYLKELPAIDQERTTLENTLEHAELDEQSQALLSLARHQQRREDFEGAARLIRARLERGVISLQSLRGSILQLALLGDGQGASLSALASLLEEEIDAMAATIREVEDFRGEGGGRVSGRAGGERGAGSRGGVRHEEAAREGSAEERGRAAAQLASGQRRRL